MTATTRGRASTLFLRSIPPRRLVGIAIIAAAAGLSIYFLAHWLPWAIEHGPWDFYIYRIASMRLFDGTMYEWADGYIYPYSPVFAWLFAPIGALGIWFWRLLHVVAVMTIPSWTIRLVVFASWPFINDTWEGNVNTFMAVAGYWALRGNRAGGWAYLTLAILIPKPIMLPGLVWLLWKEPTYRRGFVALVALHVIGALATGYAFEWLRALPGATHDMNDWYNFTPSVLIGWWWAPIGLAIGGWLTWKGRIGWASVLMVAYAAGTGHFLWLLLERSWPDWLRLPGSTRAAIDLPERPQGPDQVGSQRRDEMKGGVAPSGQRSESPGQRGEERDRAQLQAPVREE